MIQKTSDSPTGSNEVVEICTSIYAVLFFSDRPGHRKTKRQIFLSDR